MFLDSLVDLVPAGLTWFIVLFALSLCGTGSGRMREEEEEEREREKSERKRAGRKDRYKCVRFRVGEQRREQRG